jgi:hypothetical protein
LGGESYCEWAAWFQAHNKITKRPSDFDLSGYQIDHTSLLRAIRDDLEGNGYNLAIEIQNYFELTGNTAKLAGQPDIIALRDDEALIVDGKTGEPKASHVAQVMIYMWALPKAVSKYRDVKFTGMLIYKDNPTKTIEPGRVDSEFIKNLATLIRRIAGDEPCRKVPSIFECGFCPITDDDCGDRVVAGQKPDDAPPETDVF